jgi:hypothetical protein
MHAQAKPMLDLWISMGLIEVEEMGPKVCVLESSIKTVCTGN